MGDGVWVVPKIDERWVEAVIECGVSVLNASSKTLDDNITWHRRHHLLNVYGWHEESSYYILNSSATYVSTERDPRSSHKD